jgi:hypothetical protein
MAEIPINGGTGQTVQLGSRTFFQAGATTQGSATTSQDASEPGVLGGEAAAIVPQMPPELATIWQGADSPFALDVEVAPAGPGVLGDEQGVDGMLSYVPDDQGDETVYVAMQEIHTSDGHVLWDFTRPIAQRDDAAVLSGDAAMLHFPVRALPPEPSAGEPGVLGVEEVVGGLIGSTITRRIVQVLRAPVERSIRAAVERAEGEPEVFLLRDDLVPLTGAEAWRGLRKNEHGRVLLLIHGFSASIPLTFPAARRAWLAGMAAELGYDAVIGYSHPTIARDTLTNAEQLLALIPDALHLEVDLLCHSRGGLLGRTLVELAASEKLHVRRAVFCGSPHGGTRLASPERWDQLVSLAINAASLALTLSGAGAVLGVATRTLGYVLKAAAQFATDLPGVQVMRPADEPGGEFLQQLNAAGDPALAQRVQYAVAASRFSIFNAGPGSFAQTLQALAAQAFIDMPNDIVVPTDSMSAIDLPQRAMLGERTRTFAVSHFGYFDDDQVRAFVAEHLR